ncbi:hypothetical protein ES707_20653 [subsurface metagenome]
MTTGLAAVRITSFASDTVPNETQFKFLAALTAHAATVETIDEPDWQATWRKTASTKFRSPTPHAEVDDVYAGIRNSIEKHDRSSYTAATESLNVNDPNIISKFTYLFSVVDLDGEEFDANAYKNLLTWLLANDASYVSFLVFHPKAPIASAFGTICLIGEICYNQESDLGGSILFHSLNSDRIYLRHAAALGLRYWQSEDAREHLKSWLPHETDSLVRDLITDVLKNIR